MSSYMKSKTVLERFHVSQRSANQCLKVSGVYALNGMNALRSLLKLPKSEV
uniref:Uncharacterized protein n=1 Tax=Rhizophora mucronata TaxID=61149 RepID=A0A2P2Q5S1_RHIMU